ncbi:ATPase [Paramagnetospirillum caucaseum]|uniref:ATPase n=1 Tax=Paramagnetospirillum caucaseum TaxID=1244869 RepID=M3A7R7_9PROT|nr:ATP-binding protein [Paramagnetospirillum caucaseum]EME68843.1 ATPase [Paramagnetospirillum caucaseum]
MDIELGTTPSGTPALMSLEELLATRLLVQGNSGSGKSHLLRRLIEQSAHAVQQVVIDPEGDFASLAQVFGHIVIDSGAQSENGMRLIASRARQMRVSVVVNLENLDTERQMRHAGAFLNGLFDTDRQYWTPILVVVDEAQLFAPAVAGEVADDARKTSLEAMTNLMCRGRKRGLAGIIATQRLAKLAKNVAAEASNFLMGRTFLDIDMQRAADLLGIDRRQAEVFRDLECGRFVGLGPALSRRSVTIRIGEVQTRSHAGGARLMPLPDRTPEEARGLLFQANTPPPPPYVPEKGLGTEALLATIDHSPPAPVPLAAPVPVMAAAEAVRTEAPPAPVMPLPEADRGVGIDSVLDQLFSESSALGRSVSSLYDDFLARCRTHRLAGRVLDIAHFRRRLVLAQAGVTPAVATLPGWERAMSVANGLDEQFQGIFLHLAAAAIQSLPCPSDSMITQAFGSHSPRRALAALARMQQLGVVEVYEELNGQRVVVLPALQWRTAPGHASDVLAWSG